MVGDSQNLQGTEHVQKLSSQKWKSKLYLTHITAGTKQEVWDVLAEAQGQNACRENAQGAGFNSQHTQTVKV